MPFYEYKCTKCGHEEEVLQKISDEPLKKCPNCGKSTMKKQVTAAAFRLKGKGWYETDFKTANKKNIQHAEGQQKPTKKDSSPNGGKKKTAPVKSGT